MTVELVRTVFTFLIALLVIVGGFALLIIPTRVPPGDLLPFVTGVVGVVLGYVFSDRSASAGSARTLQALYTPTPAIDNGAAPLHTDNG